jgi:hypothetical protein
MDIPTPKFTDWFAWSKLDRETPQDLAGHLREVGCYLLARFAEAPPTGSADPSDPHVFYIGETHGNTTSLWGRLMCFGNSAGFYGGQWNGHYAAWGYPKEFTQDDRGPGEGGAGRRTDASRVFFALCAWPGSHPHPLRGVFPVLVEQQAIWAHAADARNGAIPRLNNSGRVPAAKGVTPPALSEDDLCAAMKVGRNADARKKSVATVVDALATTLDADGRCKSWPATYGTWEGVERKLYGNVYLYLGWRATQPEVLTLSVYQGAEGSSWACIWGEEEDGAADPAALRSLLLKLWSWWHAT